MLYLLDANVLITAKNLYYEFGRVDQYWEWLAFQAEQGAVKIPIEIFEEVSSGSDLLADWSKAHRDELLLDEDVDIELVRLVTEQGYAPDLTDIELDQIGRDPFLIAYVLAEPTERKVVTAEVRKNKQRANRTIPSVCDDLGVSCCDQWQFGRELDFKTDWRPPD